MPKFPARSFIVGGQTVGVCASLALGRGAWRLIGWTGEACHIAHQAPDGAVTVLTTQAVSGGVALAAACRIISGRERSVTADGLAVAAALVVTVSQPGSVEALAPGMVRP